MRDDFAAGASSARNKIAAFLEEHGIAVPRSRSGAPPTDEDFLRAVLAATQSADATPAEATRPRTFVRLSRVSDHSHTVRYDGPVEDEQLRAYLPFTHLPGRDLEEVYVGLALDQNSLPQAVGPLSGASVGRYGFASAKLNSLLYEMSDPETGRIESLYVPRAASVLTPRPDELYLRVYA